MMQIHILKKVRTLDIFFLGIILDKLGKFTEAIIMYDHAL